MTHALICDRHGHVRVLPNAAPFIPSKHSCTLAIGSLEDLKAAIADAGQMVLNPFGTQNVWSAVAVSLAKNDSQVSKELQSLAMMLDKKLTAIVMAKP